MSWPTTRTPGLLPPGTPAPWPPAATSRCRTSPTKACRHAWSRRVCRSTSKPTASTRAHASRSTGSSRGWNSSRRTQAPSPPSPTSACGEPRPPSWPTATALTGGTAASPTDPNAQKAHWPYSFQLRRVASRARASGAPSVADDLQPLCPLGAGHIDVNMRWRRLAKLVWLPFGDCKPDITVYRVPGEAAGWGGDRVQREIMQSRMIEVSYPDMRHDEIGCAVIVPLPRVIFILPSRDRHHPQNRLARSTLALGGERDDAFQVKHTAPDKNPIGFSEWQR